MNPKTFWEIIIGSMTVAEFLAALFFAVITAIAMVAIRVKKRDVHSPRTPEAFSWQFFWRDTLAHHLGTLILIFLSIRLSQKWVQNEWIVYGGFIIGLISDQLALIFTKLHDKATSIINKKIDNVADKVDKVDIKVGNTEDKVDEVKKAVEEVKEELKDQKDSKDN